MSLTARFKTNSDAENNGTELVFEELADANGNPPAITVARAHIRNKAYAKELEALQKKYKNSLQFLSLEQRTKIYREAFARGCVKAWRNIQLSDVTGDPSAQGYADFSTENVVKLFEKLPDFYELVLNEAGESSTFQDAVNEEIAKN